MPTGVQRYALLETPDEAETQAIERYVDLWFTDTSIQQDRTDTLTIASGGGRPPRPVLENETVAAHLPEQRLQ